MPAPKNNKFALGNSGKPKIFTSVKKLEEAVQNYFNYCDLNPCRVMHPQLARGKPVYLEMQRPYTIEGLAEYLGTTRQTLLNYQKAEGYQEYFDVITRAKQKIDRQRIEFATLGIFKEGFTKFLLINNSEYVDKVEQKTFNENINHNVTLNAEEAKLLSKELEDEC